MLRYRLFMGNNHTTQALPCLNTKQSAAKSITKDQHALGSVDLCGLKFVQTRGYLIAARGL
ncbi:hypothetical protein B0W48_01295 [Pseudoalteromonas aliena]|uniref:Uncharacterized protein n=1 Tax=Pseudoalteromonas aliena TaxID=247523 RepID=A0A1Q2GU02_9GAMM|nr:hypothetical protein B0W48_01295 [Pseudoalteromonas aliena]